MAATGDDGHPGPVGTWLDVLAACLVLGMASGVLTGLLVVAVLGVLDAPHDNLGSVLGPLGQLVPIAVVVGAVLGLLDGAAVLAALVVARAVLGPRLRTDVRAARVVTALGAAAPWTVPLVVAPVRHGGGRVGYLLAAGAVCVMGAVFWTPRILGLRRRR